MISEPDTSQLDPDDRQALAAGTQRLGADHLPPRNRPDPNDAPQLNRLAQRLPARFIERNQGQAYAAHHVVNQVLLYVLGPFSFKQVAVYRGDVLARVKREDTPSFSDEHSTVVLRNVVVGATYRLTVEIDGRRVVVEETGDVEHPENWQHDGARIKDAESDALKRCAMRIGVALELWANDGRRDLYVLDKWLPTRNKDENDTTGSAASSSATKQVTPQPRAIGDMADATISVRSKAKTPDDAAGNGGRRGSSQTPNEHAGQQHHNGRRRSAPTAEPTLAPPANDNIAALDAECRRLGLSRTHGFGRLAATPGFEGMQGTGPNRDGWEQAVRAWPQDKLNAALDVLRNLPEANSTAAAS